MAESCRHSKALCDSFRSSVPRLHSATGLQGLCVRSQHIGNLLAKLGITIQDRVAVRTGFRKGFSQLLHYTGAGGVFCDVEMENFASIVCDDEETITRFEK
jgi:hypothetical protein